MQGSRCYTRRGKGPGARGAPPRGIRFHVVFADQSLLFLIVVKRVGGPPDITNQKPFRDTLGAPDPPNVNSSSRAPLQMMSFCSRTRLAGSGKEQPQLGTGAGTPDFFIGALRPHDGPS